MKKIILSLFVLLITVSGIQAKSFKSDFNSVIRDSGVNKSAISVSVKNIATGKTVFSLNDYTSISPASVQKILTLIPAYEVLGEDYKFSTQLYKRGKDEYIIKLGADPYLTSKELKVLTSYIEPDTKHIYIDDSILDNKTWGEGWQWDDDLNTSMPRFGAYNIDRNLIKLSVVPNRDGGAPVINNPSKYPLMILNNLKSSNINNIKVRRDNDISENAIVFDGEVAKQTYIYIPANNLKRFFEIKLTQCLESHNVYIKDKYTQDKVKQTDVLVYEINHDLNIAVNDILKNSNNTAAETVFKLAGGKYTNKTGTDTDGVKVFDDYCKRNNLDNSGIKIVDGSGVSKNNLVSANFVCDFLILNKKNPVLEKLPHPGEGTMATRLLPIKDSVRVKTGTLSNISSIAGYLKTRSGKKYVFCIMINDAKLSSADKKMLENDIIREAYLKL